MLSSEVVARRCSVKKVGLKISNNSQEDTCARVSFFIKNETLAQVFSYELWEIFKDTLKAFDDFKNKQKSVRSNVFWYVKVCVFWKCIQYTIHWDKTQMLKKIPSDKINGTKNILFFFRKLQLITVLLLICDSYTSWSTSFVSLKLCVGFFIFNFFLFSKVYISFNKKA